MHEASLQPSSEAILHEYARALALLDDEHLHSLLLDDLVEEIAAHVVGPAAAALPPSEGTRLGDAAVEPFLQHCLRRL